PYCAVTLICRPASIRARRTVARGFPRNSATDGQAAFWRPPEAYNPATKRATKIKAATSSQVRLEFLEATSDHLIRRASPTVPAAPGIASERRTDSPLMQNWSAPRSAAAPGAPPQGVPRPVRRVLAPSFPARPPTGPQPRLGALE